MQERIEGDRIYLREVTVSDADGHYLKWMQDPDIVRFLESRFSDNSREGIIKFIENTNKNPDILFLAIVIKEGNRHIGNIKLGPINRHHNFADLGIIIGEKDCWGKGFATEAIKLLCEHAFKNLKIHKITAGCYSTNVASDKAFIKAGFVKEGIRIKQYIDRYGYVNHILFGLLNPY